MTPLAKRFVLVSNGPGEVSNWVWPVVMRMRACHPEAWIEVALVPCQYASGGEAAWVRQFPVDRVMTPSETLGALLRGWPSDPSPVTTVVGLGGDPMYARLIGWKTGAKVIRYTESRTDRGKGVYSLATMGDLMASRMALAFPEGKPVVDPTLCTSNPFRLLWVPSSRPYQLAAFGPFSVATIQVLCRHHPEWHMAIMRAPSIREEDWASSLQGLPESVEVVPHDLSAIAHADLMVSLPGTVTAEAGYLHTPMLTVLPLNDPRRIRLDGLLGLVGECPGVGPLLKRAVIQVLKNRPRLLAIPNRRLGRAVVPEYMGVMTPEDLARRVIATSDPAVLARCRSGLAALTPSLVPVDTLMAAL